MILNESGCETRWCRTMASAVFFLQLHQFLRSTIVCSLKHLLFVFQRHDSVAQCDITILQYVNGIHTGLASFIRKLLLSAVVFFFFLLETKAIFLLSMYSIYFWHLYTLLLKMIKCKSWRKDTSQLYIFRNEKYSD